MQSIGERLEEARKRRGISIREASEGTKIRSDFLLNFESNQFDVGLPDVYVRGFLRNYAGFLKLDAEKIVTDYNAMLIGETKLPRKDSRELFGRMELPESRRAEPETGAAGPGAARRKPEEPQESAGDILTPQQVTYIKIGGIVVAAIVAVLLIVWLVQAIVRSASSGPSPEPAAAVQTEESGPALETITLLALDTVRVKVTQSSDGRELFDGPLARGETRQIAKRGRVLITYDIGRNLNVEKDGRQFRMPIDGIGRSSFE